MITLLQLPELRKAIVAAEKRMPTPKDHTDIKKAHTSTLRKASLWWVSRDMAKLAIDAASTLPPWTPTIVAPEPTGFIWFDHPIAATPEVPSAGFLEDGSPAESVLGSAQIHGVHWFTIGTTMAFTLYGRVQDPSQRARSAPLWQDIFEIGIYMIAGDHSFDPDVDQLSAAWMTGVVHTIGAAWLLMQQPTVATTRRMRGRGAGVGGKKKPPRTSLVQVIELRRLAHKHSEEKGHTTREYHTRWMVRGHWRQQRVGPGRRYVRPVYVAPYIKGPEDAPLKTDRVNAWRR